MITKFSVTNFKSFDEEFVFDLEDTNGYTFNSGSIKNGIVNNALIYGHNGVGKSNLGLAIFEIIGHLTDYGSDKSEYANYLNAYKQNDIATFSYSFLFDRQVVTYTYEKSDFETIVSEQFTINGKDFAYINRKKNNEAKFNFAGTENLKTTIENQSLSILKYVKNNTVLDDNETNKTFLKFYRFIESMLFFRSLQKNMYLGLETGSKTLTDDIIEKQNVADFELFLIKAGIDCKLTVVKEFDKDTLAFDFNNGVIIPFFQIASQGTKALTLFYFWMQRIKEDSKVSFLFIDEFDAFYHHELSSLIVEELKKTGIQFVLTTHNTSIMSNDLLRPDCYFLMKKHAIKSLANSTPKELREAHNIEKMYKAHSFDVE